MLKYRREPRRSVRFIVHTRTLLLQLFSVVVAAVSAAPLAACAGEDTGYYTCFAPHISPIVVAAVSAALFSSAPVSLPAMATP